MHSLRGHFIGMEKELRGVVGGDGQPTETNLAEAERVLSKDALFKALVVQRSRAYVVASQRQSGAAVTSFPVREPPKVAEYSVKKTYGRLLDMVDKAFRKDKPLFVLGIYYPLAYYRGPDATIDPWIENRQKQVCGLIRSQFLKRFESSAHAFKQSCNRLLIKLLAWVTKHCTSESDKRRLERWKQKHADLVGYVHKQQLEWWGAEQEADEAEAEEDLITEEMLEDVEDLNPELYDVDAILNDTFDDLSEVAAFLEELKQFEPKLKEFNHAYEGDTSTDEKLQLELNALLAAEPELAARLDSLPGRVFSGKEHPTPGARGVFFCYRLPRPETGRTDGDAVWTEEAGITRWYLYELDRETILEEPAEIVDAIRSNRDSLRRCTIPQVTLAAVRAKIEKHIKNTFFKRLQAPVGVKPVLKAWMELN
ncbi:MAG TPA: hypothetical protein PK867_28940 [Pirellulales bacterium]|nr:hypothetical protein [Pirellulales bacterium]